MLRPARAEGSVESLLTKIVTARNLTAAEVMRSERYGRPMMSSVTQSGDASHCRGIAGHPDDTGFNGLQAFVAGVLTKSSKFPDKAVEIGVTFLTATIPAH